MSSLMHMDFHRQLGILSPDALEDLQVTMIGAGGIGSPTVLALAKMGVQNIKVYDADFLEKHNLPNQMYRTTDVSRPKVEALAEVVKDYTGLVIDRVSEAYTNQPLEGVVISGVDSMAARKEIWKQVQGQSFRVPLYIEARMGAEVARIYTVDPEDTLQCEWYEEFLYSDEQAQNVPCTERAIIYCTFMIASLLASQVKKYVTGGNLCGEIIFDMVTLSVYAE